MVGERRGPQYRRPLPQLSPAAAVQVGGRISILAEVGPAPPCPVFCSQP